MNIRLHGTEPECTEAAWRLSQVLDVLSVSRPYPDRGMSRLVRVYLEARLTPPGGSIQPPQPALPQAPIPQEGTW